VKLGIATAVALDGADIDMIRRDIPKESPALLHMLPFSCRDSCPPYDSRPENNDFIDYYLSGFLDDEVVIVEQGNNSIGGFHDADDVVGIYIKLLFVHAGKKDHSGTPYLVDNVTYK
jgi:hypothetical protein